MASNIKFKMSDGTDYFVPMGTKVPIHPEGYKLYRGYMTDVAILNNDGTAEVKKKKESIVNKMCGDSIKCQHQPSGQAKTKSPSVKPRSPSPVKTD